MKKFEIINGRVIKYIRFDPSTIISTTAVKISSIIAIHSSINKPPSRERSNITIEIVSGIRINFYYEFTELDQLKEDYTLLEKYLF